MNNHQSFYLSRGFTHGDSSFVRSMSNAECMCHIYLFIAKHERSTTAEDAAHWSWAKVSSFSCHAILTAYANTCPISRSLFITHHSEHVYGSKLKQENRRNRVFKSIKTGFVSTQMCNLWSFSHPAFLILYSNWECRRLWLILGRICLPRHVLFLDSLAGSKT